MAGSITEVSSHNKLCTTESQSAGWGGLGWKEGRAIGNMGVGLYTLITDKIRVAYTVTDN